MFKFSKRSKENLATVVEPLQEVTRKALQITPVDFAVICGKRTVEEQEALIKAGRSRTRKSKHLTGHAVDLMPVYGKHDPADFAAFLAVADAMRTAALELHTRLRWGGAWHMALTDAKNAHEALKLYTHWCTERKRKPFLDLYHFELIQARGRQRSA